jgi:hypothetical protein
MPSRDAWNRASAEWSIGWSGTALRAPEACEDQKSGELGRHVAQVFKMGTGREDVRDRLVVERVGHGHAL